MHFTIWGEKDDDEECVSLFQNLAEVIIWKVI